jgi:hypothetical protein
MWVCARARQQLFAMFPWLGDRHCDGLLSWLWLTFKPSPSANGPFPKFYTDVAVICYPVKHCEVSHFCSCTTLGYTRIPNLIEFRPTLYTLCAKIWKKKFTTTHRPLSTHQPPTGEPSPTKSFAAHIHYLPKRTPKFGSDCSNGSRWTWDESRNFVYVNFTNFQKIQKKRFFADFLKPLMDLFSFLPRYVGRWVTPPWKN